MTKPPTVEFEHYTAAQARALAETVEDIYRRSYLEAIASGDPFDSPAQFMHRFDSYTSPDRDTRLELVMARVEGVPVGQAWGWPLSANAAWWKGLQLDDTTTDHAAFTSEDGVRTFGFSEIMVCAEHAGRGIGRRLHDELLSSRPEQRASLLVEPGNQRAYARYLRWGWRRVGRLRPKWPDAPQFDVLIRPLSRSHEA